jgi:Family of unknown function (DUF6152)
MSGPRFYRRWIACALLVPAAGGAHHSRTQYDGSETQEIEGELTSVSWANPHAAFSVRVTSASGESATWQLESWGSPYVLSRMGVTQDQFVVGTEVRLAGRVSTLVPNRFLLTNMLRPDGTEVVLTTDGDAFWNGRQVGGRSQWRNQEISTAAEENRGLFRVWSTARMGQGRANRIMLTQSALAARESFDQSRSFVVTCEPQGMPTVMNWVYPFELSQPDPSTIILRSEYFDLERTIHMGPAAAVPAGLVPSRLGLSTGRFEDGGRSLVVETTAVNWPYYDTIGTPLTPDVKITERFTLSDDQSALTYRQTVTDPATFTEPAIHESQHLALGESIEPFVCAPDL